MINFDNITEENTIRQNLKLPYIPGNRYKVLIIGNSISEKANTLLNLTNYQPDVDKIYLYAIDPYEAKYQVLIKKRESVSLKDCNDSKAFTEYSNDMQYSKTQILKWVKSR